MTVSTEKGVTSLTGPIADQAALQGILSTIQNLGFELVEVKQLS